MARFFGYNAPFTGGNEKVMSRQLDEKLIKNDMIQLLLTAPGERVMRPDFGTPLRSFLFESIASTSLSELRLDIMRAVESFESRVELTDVFIAADEELLTVKLFGRFVLDRFSAPNAGENTDLLLELNLPTASAGNRQ